MRKQSMAPTPNAGSTSRLRSTSGSSARIFAKRQEQQQQQQQMQLLLQQQQQIQQEYFWAGKTVQQVSGLKRGDTAEFLMTACFCAPGTYNLNHFQFVLTCPSFLSHPLTITSPLQHFITITSPPPSPPPSALSPALSLIV